MDTHGRPPLVGIMPAAGRATRLELSLGSKEVQLIATGDPTGSQVPVGRLLLEQWQRAGCVRATIVLRPGKWDIIECFGDDAGISLPVSYVTMRDPWGPPFTISQAFAHTRDCAIITGFPDILLDPPDVAEQVIERLYIGDAEVVLATFICAADGSADCVDVDKSGRVVQLTPKELEPAWGADPRTWMMLAWKPSFTRFFESTLAKFRMQLSIESESAPQEWPMGSVLAAALQSGIAIDTVHFPHGRWHDIGTPQRLAEAADFFSLKR